MIVNNFCRAIDPPHVERLTFGHRPSSVDFFAQEVDEDFKPDRLLTVNSGDVATIDESINRQLELDLDSCFQLH